MVSFAPGRQFVEDDTVRPIALAASTWNCRGSATISRRSLPPSQLLCASGRARARTSAATASTRSSEQQPVLKPPRARPARGRFQEKLHRAPLDHDVAPPVEQVQQDRRRRQRQRGQECQAEKTHSVTLRALPLPAARRFAMRLRRK